MNQKGSWGSRPWKVCSTTYGPVRRSEMRSGNCYKSLDLTSTFLLFSAISYNWLDHRTKSPKSYSLHKACLWTVMNLLSTILFSKISYSSRPILNHKINSKSKSTYSSKALNSWMSSNKNTHQSSTLILFFRNYWKKNDWSFWRYYPTDFSLIYWVSKSDLRVFLLI